MKNLRDLLFHELEDLYSAEEQIIDGLPAMIEKAKNWELRSALSDHLKVTRKQKDRLDKIKKRLGEEDSQEEKGFFARLFSGDSKHHCEAMEGLIREGEKMMGEDMEPAVMDAAIIAAAQKIEHYEIAGYGTAKAYALHMGLDSVAELIDQTLNEEYSADDSLTDLAVSEVNLKAGDEEGMPGLKKLTGSRRGSRSSENTGSPARRSSGNKSRSLSGNESTPSSSGQPKSSTAGNRSRSKSTSSTKKAASKSGVSSRSKSRSAAKSKSR